MRETPLYCWNGIQSDSVRDLLRRGAPRRLSLRGLWSYLAYGCVYAPWTLVEGVECAPDEPAPDFSLKEWTPEAVQAAVTEAVDTAVRRVSRKGDGEGGVRGVTPAFLSGGIDSSTIAASLRRQYPDEEIRTYCVIHEDPRTDERQWARMVAEANHTKHTELMLTDEMVRSNLRQMLSDYDQPSLDGVNFWFACKLTAEAGEKEILSGEGGDELFAGYGVFSKARQMYAAADKLGPVRGSKFLGGLIESLAPNEKFRKLGQLIGCKTEAYYLSRRVLSDRVIASLLSDALLDALADAKRRGEWNWLAEVSPAPDASDLINRISWLEMQTSMASMYLRDGYQLSKPHNLAVSCPFMDMDLISLVYTIPGKLKCDPELSKPLLVRAAGAGFPHECAVRKKQGFTLPFDRYFSGGLKEELEHFFLGGESALFKGDALGRIWNDYRSGRINWARVWALFVVENWCRENKVVL